MFMKYCIKMKDSIHASLLSEFEIRFGEPKFHVSAAFTPNEEWMKHEGGN